LRLGSRMTEDEQKRREERARRINELLEELPMKDGKKQTARSVSLDAGLSTDGIRNILRLSDPQISTLTSLAPVLGCDLGYLTLEQDVPKKYIAKNEIEDAISPPGPISAIKVHKVPVISWAVAGDTMVALGRYVNESTPTILVDLETDTLLATYVPDEAMSADAHEGDVIVYDYSDKDLVDRAYYLFIYAGRLVFRKYRDSHGPVRFEATSTERQIDPIFPSDILAIEIVGRVRRVIKSL
jgi:hypothetical protein